MPTPLDLVEAEAMKLSPEERSLLAERLLVSAQYAPSLHPAWEAEIGRRVAAMEAGRSRFMPAEEAMAKLAAHIQSRRPAAT